MSAAGCNGKKACRVVTDFARTDDFPVDLVVENDEKAPREIVLDIDATDFEIHG